MKFDHKLTNDNFSVNQIQIDLHGMSIKEGKAKVIEAIKQGINKNNFCIKIITGRGAHSSSNNNYRGAKCRGFLFKSVPMWINRIECNHVNCIIKGVGSYKIIINHNKHDKGCKHAILEQKRFIENLYLTQSKLMNLIGSQESEGKHLQIINTIRSNRLLLEKISCDGTTILMLAAALNQIKTMEVLLEYDYTTSIQPRLLKKSREDGTNVLMIATMFEHVDSINFLLNKAPSLLKMKKKDGTSIIQIAAYTSNPKIVLDTLYQHLTQHHRQKGYTDLFREYKAIFNHSSNRIPIIESDEFKRYKSEHAWFFYDKMSLFLQKIKEQKSKTSKQIIKVRFLKEIKRLEFLKTKRPQEYKFKNPKWMERMDLSKEDVIEKLKHKIIFLLKVNNIFRKCFLRFNNSKKVQYNRHFKHAINNFIKFSNSKVEESYQQVVSQKHKLRSNGLKKLNFIEQKPIIPKVSLPNKRYMIDQTTKEIFRQTSHHLLSPRTQAIFSSIGNACSLEKFEKSVSNAADVNHRNIGKRGDTPLMTILRQPKLMDGKEIAKIEILFKYGANLKAKNNKGDTAEGLLKEHKQREIIIKLMKKLRL